jgi:pyridoxal phosphate enzyme (YggS family)
MNPMTNLINTNLALKYQNILQQLQGKAKLLAVSKTRTIDEIESLYHLAHRDFGENRVQELAEKAIKLKHLDCIRWHFIGPLQRNKVKSLINIDKLIAIHSVDRFELIDELAKHHPPRNLGLFLQFNTAKEEQKQGFESYTELAQAAKMINQLDCYDLVGLMTMSKLRTQQFESDALDCFKQLKELRDRLVRELNIPKLELSMGMSADFNQALACDTDWVRIGSQLFGQKS